MKDIVIRKILTLSLIGVLCLIFGIVYGWATRDKLLIVMSLIICAVNVYKITEIIKIEKKEQYLVISGKCIDSVYKVIGKYRIFQIQNGDDIMEISVPKTVKLKRNEEYNLYFKKPDKDTDIYGNWLKNKILSDNFLGYELLVKEEEN